MRRFLIFAAFVLLFPGTALALEFSADNVTTYGNHKSTGKVFVKTNGYRMDTEGLSIIMRTDKKLVWRIMPTDKTYMEIPFDPRNKPNVNASEKIEGETERKQVGSDTIDGHPTKKFLITVAGGNKTQQEYMWIATDIPNFPMKRAAVDGSWTQEYKNITVGEQPDSIFDLPAGYKNLQNPGAMHHGTREDLALTEVENVQAKSEWLESRKKLFRTLLKNAEYDILIVPFQVRGYAIDRIGRSLMTRYLSKRLVNSTSLTAPDPTLVARAFGAVRTIEDDEIFSLANELKVRILVRGYVGHDANGKMKVTLVVQKRDNSDKLGVETPSMTLEWKDIEFSDEHLPSEAFLSILDDVVSKMPVSQTKKAEKIFYQKEEDLNLPDSISALVKPDALTPVGNAYNLQLFGMLYPEDNVADDVSAREEFFERSLTALTDVSPQSPDYMLLKARALFYLSRRPAALVALKSPINPEEKAFMAYLNGNLPELEKWSFAIRAPFRKVLADIELNDLRVSYHNDPFSDETIDKILGNKPAWEMLITRRLKGKDAWYLQSNIYIKKMLDDLFPLPNQSAEDIIKRKLVTGASIAGDDEIDLAVYGHYKTALLQDSRRLLSDGSSQPVERDCLDLLYAIGEANIIKNIKMALFTQGLPEKALEAINGYELLYMGHIQMTYLKSNALAYIMGKKEGEVRDAITKRIRDISSSLCYWSQEQTYISVNVCGMNFPYRYDFPRRWFTYWRHQPPYVASSSRSSAGTILGSNPAGTGVAPSKGINDENGLEDMFLWLLYTNDNFLSLESTYKKLIDLHKERDAEALWTANRDRFVGSPTRSAFIAQRKKGEGKDAEMVYREALAANPEVWDSYIALAKLLISHGDYRSAFDILKKYPPFGNDKYDNTVALSQHAFTAGNEFWKRALIDEAQYFFRLSASYQTGSAGEFLSSMLLGLLNEDYEQMASQALADAKRYEDSIGYAFYITSLHLMGHHDEAAALSNTLSISHHIMTNWMGVFVGSRMAEEPQEVALRWLTPERLRYITDDDAGKFVLNTLLLDRKPDEQISGAIPGSFHTRSPRGPNHFHMAHFAKGYVSLAQKRYAAAYDVFSSFRKRYLSQQTEFTLNNYGYAIPYYVWSSIKSGRTSDAQDLMDMVQQIDENNFYLHLSRAFMTASKGNHVEAVRWLRAALNNSPNILLGTISPWYQVVEACEWLYADTQLPEYRALAVELAKKHQRILPMFAWAYAVEAKYTETAAVRRRPLAITLYLDRHSEHIATISDNEKNEAMTWLKNNNPFLLKQPQKSTL
jgi:tetratricopeptide (TPR) repeat protein